MTIRLTTILGTTVLLAQCLLLDACSNRRATTATTATATSTAPTAESAGPSGAGGAFANGVDGKKDPNCYSTVGAKACPPDDKDPSGMKLPTPGGICHLPPCKPCGSDTVPAFRDDKGAAQPGWCICVPKSDDSGIFSYSCFSPKDWRQYGWK